MYVKKGTGIVTNVLSRQENFTSMSSQLILRSTVRFLHSTHTLEPSTKVKTYTYFDKNMT